jgi:hypothetical protein
MNRSRRAGQKLAGGNGNQAMRHAPGTACKMRRVVNHTTIAVLALAVGVMLVTSALITGSPATSPSAG